MIRALMLAALLHLSGCIGATGVLVLEGVASGATIAKDVIGIDVSLQQNQPGKVPVSRLLPAR